MLIAALYIISGLSLVALLVADELQDRKYRKELKEDKS